MDVPTPKHKNQKFSENEILAKTLQILSGKKLFQHIIGNRIYGVVHAIKLNSWVNDRCELVMLKQKPWWYSFFFCDILIIIHDKKVIPKQTNTYTIKKPYTQYFQEMSQCNA